MTSGTAEVSLPTTTSFYHYTAGHKGILSWLLSTDHKKIGLMYTASMLAFFLSGMTLGFLIRTELISPGSTIMSGRTYNTVFTLHGITMIFLFVIPGLMASLGNFFLPLQIGARDVAFPRLNLLSWYLFVGGGITIYASLFVGPETIDTGWTFYAPYSIVTNSAVSMAGFGVFLVGFSSMLTGINFVTTVHRMRAPGMTWTRMPLFCWALYTTGWMQILATPVITITLVMVILERFIGVGFFDPKRGGDPLLFQHMFWIYSHPAVYIMILPAMGAVSEIIPTFSRRNIYGYKYIAFSTVSIAVIGFIVWGHHMFTSGMSDGARFVFSLLTFFVAVPTGIKILNWVTTLYKGSITLEVPLLYALSFIFLFSIGGVTGLVQGALAADIHLHDTSFIVAHFHYVMFGGTGMAFFGAVHYWFPKMFGRMYHKFWAMVSFWLIFVGFNTLYFPMFILGFLGMPRRYFDYLPMYQPLHVVSSIGSYVMIAGILIMAWNWARSLRSGPKAPENPWGGTTLEWKVPSPPPVENFRKLPVVDRGAYDHPSEGNA